jgi:uncharacterized protein
VTAIATPITERRWYREPMVWLVIALPMSSIIAGTSLLAFAIHLGGADAVPESVRRMSQIQIADLGADHRALASGLSAELTIDAGTGALRLGIASEEAAAAPGSDAMTLLFVHPTQAAQDHRVRLVRAGEHWLGRFEGQLDHDWQLRLAPDSQQWRLEGRTRPQQTTVSLRPRAASG